MASTSADDIVSKLVMLLERHMDIDIPREEREKLLARIRASYNSPLKEKEFARKIKKAPMIEDTDEETTAHIYIRRLLNNTATSHAIPSDGERIAYAYQARARGGTSTKIYLQSILENPELVRMMEDVSDAHPVSLLGRITRDTQITPIIKVRMRRPVLVIPIWHEADKVRKWERYGPETKYYEIVMKVPIRSITKEEYEAIVNARRSYK